MLQKHRICKAHSVIVNVTQIGESRRTCLAISRERASNDPKNAQHNLKMRWSENRAEHIYISDNGGGGGGGGGGVYVCRAQLNVGSQVGKLVCMYEPHVDRAISYDCAAHS